MPKHAHVWPEPAPPSDLDVHRRIAMRRRGLHGAMARVVAELALGEPRDTVVLVAVVNVGSISAVHT